MGELNRYQKKLEDLSNAFNLRVLPEGHAANLINLCSNDYLGLNSDNGLLDEFLSRSGSKAYRFSSCSSRLQSGNFTECTMLENLIARSYGTEACLLYNSGYNANIGIISSLAVKSDLIVADKLVHASIIDGVKLCPATFMRFRHLDYSHLEKLLMKHRNQYGNVFIISESIFSMDGDCTDLQQLVELKKKYNCFLYIDEAHAFGVKGQLGLGCAEEQEVIKEIDFIVGTFGKALASLGAFVVCNNLFKQYLVNHSRSLIYTTALPPLNLAWTRFLFEKLPEFHLKREKLKLVSTQFARLLDTKPQSHIIPFVIGTNRETVAASLKLKQHGFNVLPVRYPTVPEGTARLRFSLSADMSIDQLMPIKNILKSNG
ncbi:MAG: 8-amino-7-oxononanoate synthase [Bacteroidota bacterium]|nr:8-amino-7-oxononanoate synthase [Bacteroidota bacterium]